MGEVGEAVGCVDRERVMALLGVGMCLMVLLDNFFRQLGDPPAWASSTQLSGSVPLASSTRHLAISPTSQLRPDAEGH